MRRQAKQKVTKSVQSANNQGVKTHTYPVVVPSEPSRRSEQDNNADPARNVSSWAQGRKRIRTVR